CPAHLSLLSHPRRPPRPPLFPYTTLFRSLSKHERRIHGLEARAETVGARGLRQLDSVTHGPRLSFVENRRAMVTGCPVVHNGARSEEHTSELQSLTNLVCRLLLEKKKTST